MGLVRAGHQVKVLAVNSDKYKVDPKSIPAEYLKSTGLELVHLDLRIKVIPAMISLLRRRSYHVERFINENFRQKLIHLLRQQSYDVVQLETIFVAPYIDDIRKHSKALIVLRAHNVEHLIWERLAMQTKNLLKRFYLSDLARTLKHYEKYVLIQVDGVAAITRNDAAFFRGITHKPVIDLPFGVQNEQIVSQVPALKGDRLFHIGAMNWMPNEEGMRWFLDFIWPELHRINKKLKLTLAGRFMPAWLVTGYKPNVEVVGEVDDARRFIEEHDVAIVPLRSGSGIRIKIIEAMAAGKAVVATSVGAEGIIYTHGQNIFIANKLHDFIDFVQLYTTQPEQVETIAAGGLRLVNEHYKNEELVQRLLAFYGEARKRLTSVAL
jgi:glycosyltransferase involved in cell wall biosynthesis